MNQSPQISPEDVLVRVQATPNPYALKFIVNQSLKDEGKATIQDPSEAPNLPLVQDLFHISGIKQLYLFQNTLTVTHGGELMEDDLEQQVTSVLKTRVPIHDSGFEMAGEEKVKAPKDHSDKPEEIQKIDVRYRSDDVAKAYRLGIRESILKLAALELMNKHPI